MAVMMINNIDYSDDDEINDNDHHYILQEKVVINPMLTYLKDFEV